MLLGVRLVLEHETSRGVGLLTSDRKTQIFVDFAGDVISEGIGDIGGLV